MKITQVKLAVVRRGCVRAFASVVIEGSFKINHLRVVEDHGRLFVAMPSLKGRDGSFKDICHPTNAEFRQRLEAAVLERYEREKNREIERELEQRWAPCG